MADKVEYITETGQVYVKINGCLGGKACKSQADAEIYAGRVSQGLVRFEPVSDSALRHILKSKALVRN